MREIKFRAWDKRGSRMICWNIIGTQMLQEVIGFGRADNFIVGDTYIPMQYTGLKDKNGVEIYEGDVLKFDYPDSVDKNDDDATIEYWPFNRSFGETVVVKRSRRGFYPFTECSSEVEVDYTYIAESDCIEVIGNIHENKDLLDA